MGKEGGDIYVIFTLLSGSAYKITVRESDPIIWYKPVEESVRGGSYLDRLVQAVSSVLQVWWSKFCMLYNHEFNWACNMALHAMKEFEDKKTRKQKNTSCKIYKKKKLFFINF